MQLVILKQSYTISTIFQDQTIDVLYVDNSYSEFSIIEVCSLLYTPLLEKCEFKSTFLGFLISSFLVRLMRAVV